MNTRDAPGPYRDRKSVDSDCRAHSTHRREAAPGRQLSMHNSSSADKSIRTRAR